MHYVAEEFGKNGLKSVLGDGEYFQKPTADVLFWVVSSVCDTKESQKEILKDKSLIFWL